MISGMNSVEELYGATVTGTDGDKIGKVDEVYLDNATNQPEWVSVKTGLFGSNVSLIPLSSATVSGDTITVPFEKSMVKDAPHHDPGHELSEADEDDLYRYYGISSSGGTVTDTTTTTGTTGTVGTTGTTDAGVRGAGHDTSGPNTDDAMTRSKEELHVAKESREAGRARLRK
ncbi:PRC-barrel domain-containing protein, partial [Kineococcus auxinigenes]